MDKPNRTIAPNVALLDHLELKTPGILSLSNDLTVHHIAADHLEVIKIEFVFNGGIWNQQKPLTALFTANLLKEGTARYTSQEVAELLDFYGAYLQVQHSHHFITVSLYAVKEHIKALMPLLESVIKEPLFDDKELEIAIKNKKQEYLVESEKVKTLSIRSFNSAFFGKDHPYGNYLELSDFEKITSADLKLYHDQFFQPSSCDLFITGRIDGDVLNLLEAAFGNNWNGRRELIEPVYVSLERTSNLVFTAKKDAVQCALKMGREGVSKQHPDYHGLTILNTVFGGYFGSRLMKNIREEKGYTYGIGSYLHTNKNASILAIQSEMATENTLPALEEIFHEMRILREELIPLEELDMVRNFLLGELARSFDGPFALAESHLMLWLFQLDESHIHNYIDTILTITPKQLQSLACFYFNESHWLIVAAGNPSLRKALQKYNSTAR